MSTRNRFIVKSVTKFVVFDNQKRAIVTSEYQSFQNAEAEARTMNAIEVFAKTDAASFREVSNALRSS